MQAYVPRHSLSENLSSRFDQRVVQNRRSKKPLTTVDDVISCELIALSQWQVFLCMLAAYKVLPRQLARTTRPRSTYTKCRRVEDRDDINASWRQPSVYDTFLPVCRGTWIIQARQTCIKRHQALLTGRTPIYSVNYSLTTLLLGLLGSDTVFPLFFIAFHSFCRERLVNFLNEAS